MTTEELTAKKRDLLRRITMELESYAPEFIFDVEILLQEVREIFEKELNHDQ